MLSYRAYPPAFGRALARAYVANRAPCDAVRVYTDLADEQSELDMFNALPADALQMQTNGWMSRPQLLISQ